MFYIILSIKRITIEITHIILIFLFFLFRIFLFIFLILFIFSPFWKENPLRDNLKDDKYVCTLPGQTRSGWTGNTSHTRSSRLVSFHARVFFFFFFFWLVSAGFFSSCLFPRVDNKSPPQKKNNVGDPQIWCKKPILKMQQVPRSLLQKTRRLSDPMFQKRPFSTFLDPLGRFRDVSAGDFELDFLKILIFFMIDRLCVSFYFIIYFLFCWTFCEIVVFGNYLSFWNVSSCHFNYCFFIFLVFALLNIFNVSCQIFLCFVLCYYF